MDLLLTAFLFLAGSLLAALYPGVLAWAFGILALASCLGAFVEWRGARRKAKAKP